MIKKWLLLLTTILSLVACNGSTPPSKPEDVNKLSIGCKASAGYSWCAKTNQCERPWELAKKNGFEAVHFNTFCADQPIPPGGDRDEHDCKASAGYSWCAKTNQCEQPWELAKKNGFEAVHFNTFCAGQSIPPGGDVDEHGCKPSTGTSWCARTNQCERPADLAKQNDFAVVNFKTFCDHKPILVGGDRDEHGCIGSAGASWCAKTNQCERPWELAKKHNFNLSPENFANFCNN